MFVRIAVRFVEVQMPDKGCYGHLLSTDSAAILTKQAERQFIIKQNMQLRTTGIFHPINKYPPDNRNYFMQVFCQSAPSIN